jgi:hypothetical protein
MVTRRTNRTRTVNKDSGRVEEFEKFSFALDEPFSPAFFGRRKTAAAEVSATFRKRRFCSRISSTGFATGLQLPPSALHRYCGRA